jgi:hypothetical protein
MSRKRERPAEIGGYWLSQRPNSNARCGTWFDAATRQTRRASLGTDDFQQAELKLAAWIAKNAEVRNQHPADLPLATVLTRYWHGHAINLPSADQAKIELRYSTEFFTTDMVADLTPTRPEAFVEHLRGLGHSSGYISRTLSSGRAAINRAHKRGELACRAVHRRRRDQRGQARQGAQGQASDAGGDRGAVRCCRPGSRVHVPPARVLHPGATRSDPGSDRVPARPRSRNDRPQPRWRRQTRKYRPVVLEAATLTPWLDQAKTDHFDAWHGRPLNSIKTAWRRLRANAELDAEVQPYSIRHTMAREMRRRRVPLEQRQTYLGHLPRGSARTTAIYAPDGARAAERCGRGDRRHHDGRGPGGHPIHRPVAC